MVAAPPGFFFHAPNESLCRFWRPFFSFHFDPVFPPPFKFATTGHSKFPPPRLFGPTHQFNVIAITPNLRSFQPNRARFIISLFLVNFFCYPPVPRIFPRQWGSLSLPPAAGVLSLFLMGDLFCSFTACIPLSHPGLFRASSSIFPIPPRSILTCFLFRAFVLHFFHGPIFGVRSLNLRVFLLFFLWSQPCFFF